MANFSDYFPKLLRYEGNYCHSANDPGGETYRGIARKYNGKWPGWATVDAVKQSLHLVSPVAKPSWAALSAALSANPKLSADIKAFYQAHYWDPLRLNEVGSQSIAEQLADHGVNAGLSRPAKMLQYLLKTQFGASHLKVDGKVGPQSIAALNDVLPELFYPSLIELRRAHYYYRAGSPLSSTPNMAHWVDFLKHTLNVTPDLRMQQYLKSWLSRTRVPFVS